MTSKPVSHLRLHVDSDSSSTTSGGVNFDLTATLRAFSEATGWVPRPRGGTPHQSIAAESDPTQPLLPVRQRMQMVSNLPMDGMLDAEDYEQFEGTSEEVAWQLFEQIDALVQQVNSLERTVRQQEAQLATGLGVGVKKDEAEILASRFSESLHRAVELTGSDAAALYLLDDTTSQLKMRACWGMSTAALAKPPRELRGALADLEALLGNAVLLENTELASEWNCPENYAAAMCVPIGSPTMPHGTLWLWSDHVRDFGSADIDAAKAACDKILVDIERSVLADEVLRTRGLDRQIDAASLIQASRLPHGSQPLHSDYEVGGWTFQGQSLGGNFHTWTINRQQQLCAALGAAATHGTAGALVATSVQTVVETCWNTNHKPHQILRKANDILWEAEGDWRCSLCYLQIHPQSGSTQLAMAGDLQGFLIGSRGFRTLGSTPTRLALQPDTKFQNQQLYLEAGELLLIASADVVGGLVRGGFTQDNLLEIVRDMQDDAVQDIVDHLARKLPMLDPNQPTDADRSLLIVRRRY